MKTIPIDLKGRDRVKLLVTPSLGYAPNAAKSDKFQLKGYIAYYVFVYF